MSNYFWSSFINVSLFILCSCFQEVQTRRFVSWEPVLKDLEQIIKIPTKVDASLYTATYSNHCKISVVRCFHLEMKVLLYEANIGGDSDIYNSTRRVLRSVGRFLDDEQDKETSQCQECETFEEKQYTEFIENFQDIARRLHREEKWEK
nr:PREDICTED: interleukin-15 [Anolis carolinensis]XP_008110071.1 PREDICTED: interleukin-15 [Anolis carolinensis]XP_008110072.1 PREDICTED: interleukin-15 [Anolis carolinensis]XP_008110073.1 PREDICTED: interleukin-15 [Anolis carolinensis]|eukprot:XP_003221714.1 PREDICTED: interleukin-15 [Anolis carolinensis]